MKKVFRQNPVAYFWQLFIWIFIIVLLLILFFVSGDYSKDAVELSSILFIILESMATLAVPVTMKKIVFSDSSVSVKIGFICIKRLYYNEIKYIDIFRKMSGPQLIQFVFFSKELLREEQVNDLFEKLSLKNRKNFIYCDYPQKNLEELLKTLFPQQFNPEHCITYLSYQNKKR